MIKSKSLSLWTLMSLMFVQLAWASPAALPVKFVDALLKETGVVDLLARNGILGDTARSVQSYVSNSFVALSSKGSNLSAAELKEILQGLAVTGDDLRLKNELIAMLEKNSDEVTREDLVTTINNLIYLANRHGIRSSVVLACSECVNESLKRHGFKFTFSTLRNQSAQEVLENVLPRSPKDLSNYISRKMTSMKLGNYRNIPRELVAPEEERILGLFLALAEHGTVKQKEFVQSILEISKLPSGEVRLLNPENPHTFWKMFSEDMTDDFMDSYSRLLREAAEESQGEVSKEEAFFRVLARQHQDDPASLEYVQMLRSKKCLFK